MQARLIIHPATGSVAVRELAVRLTVVETGLRLAYGLCGDLAQLRIPPRRACGRADGLWKHSCFEVFIRVGRGPAYLEFNFAPSGEWAAYRFADYRKGGVAIESISSSGIHVAQTRDRLELEAVIPLQDLSAIDGSLQLGLSAVIEAQDGGLSYWALAHPAEKPDFHHPDSFVLSLPMDGAPQT